MSCNCNKSTCNECNDCKGGQNEYILVKATASNSCSSLEEAASECPKQEQMYDSVLSGFIVPIAGENITFRVCNASVYSIGQWFYFPNARTFIRVLAINGNDITVSSTCSDGKLVDGFDGYGQTITAGSSFTVTGQPYCADTESRLEDVNSALAEAQQVCVPEMQEANYDSTVQVVGRVEADNENLSFRKCIRRISDFLFKEGCPIWPAIKTISSSGNAAYTRVGINKTSGEVRKYNAVVDGALPDEGYVEVFYEGDVKFIGPSYVTRIFETQINLFKLGEIDAPVAANGTVMHNFTLSALSTIFNNTLKKTNAIWIELEITLYPKRTINDGGALRFWDFELDGNFIYGFDSSGRSSGYNTIRKIIKVTDLTQAFELESINESTNTAYLLHISVDVNKVYV